MIYPVNPLEDRFRAVFDLEAAPWQNAITMPSQPHYHSALDLWKKRGYLSRQRYTAISQAILATGDIEEYRRTNYPMLFANGYKYWPTGWVPGRSGEPRRVPTVFNRLRRYYDSPLDEIASQHDLVYETNPVLVDASYMIRSVLGTLIPPRAKVLDVRCRTGLLLDWGFTIAPDSYLGYEESHELSLRFEAKHPDYRVISAPFRDAYPRDRFDAIVGLFDAGNGLTDLDVQKLDMLLKPNGVWAVMTPHPETDDVERHMWGIEPLSRPRSYLARAAQQRLDLGQYVMYIGGRQ